MEQRIDTEQQSDQETPQALVVPSGMKNLVEALVFAASEPLTIRQLKAIYEFSAPAGSGEERHIEADELRSIISGLNAEYEKQDRPYRILRIAGGYQFATIRDYADWLGKLRREQSRKKLSQSAIESLAIIAYKQPVTKAEVEAIRGVNCDYVMKTLLEKELVRVTGRAETVGRPLLYGTSREFLVHFGLDEVTDLPRPREIEEILGETQFETERRMLEAQEAADKIKEDDFKSRLPHIPKRKAELGESPVELFERKRPTVLGTRQPGEEEEPAERPAPVRQGRKDAGSPIVPRRTYVSGPDTDTETPAAHRALPTDDHSTPPPADQEASPSRWRSWKEKIQGFIRRLFD